MISNRFYDPDKKKLVYVGRSATPEFWDEHWSTADFAETLKQHNRFLHSITRNFLKRGSKVLEGGCGNGKNVYSLQKLGYQAFGIDYAPQTVALTNKYCPYLTILAGDVRALSFKENFFDGYWSLGVIEHFYAGFNDIAKEMARVVRPGGYLFLTFPYMNPLRKLKARLGLYPLLPQDFSPENYNFYQFSLDAKKTEKQFHQYGFQLIHSESIDGVKGLKDELPFLHPVLQKVYDSPLFVLRVCRKLLDIMFKKWCGHGVLLVFEAKGSK